MGVEKWKDTANRSCARAGAPHLAPFEMWVSGSEKTPQINHERTQECSVPVGPTFLSAAVEVQFDNRAPSAQKFSHRGGVRQLSMSAMAC